MIEFSVPLRDVMINPETDESLVGLSRDDAIARLKDLYGFLRGRLDVTIDGDQVNVVIHHELRKAADDTMRLYGRAVKHAEKGRYDRAINLFGAVLSEMPMFTDARRNLGMAYMESGNIPDAERVLVEAIRLRPEDAWAYLVLANIYAKHEGKPGLAERYYRKALELNPGDAYALTSYAGLCMEQRRYDQARALFSRAMATGVVWPNTYYGLALLELEQGNPLAAKEALDRLFGADFTKDARSSAVLSEIRKLYLAICRAISQAKHEQLMDRVQGRRRAVGEITGFPIDLVEDSTLEGIQAVAESAWRHKADRHVIRYDPSDEIVVPHLLLHELEHLLMEHEDREAGQNRLFTSTAATREHAIRSMGSYVRKLERRGLPEAAITNVVLQLLNGMVSQLHSTALDMVIEHRIHSALPEFRENQLASLDLTSRRASAAVTSPDVREVTPPFIYEASAALNAAYALFIDGLSDERTDFAAIYQGRAIATGKRLFALWREIVGSYQPGDEYALVDQFADVLGLRSWYEWLEDTSQPSTPEGATNPELLKAKESATVMYLLDALKRFSGMTTNEVFAVASEIALMGRNGIDYTSPERRYSLSAFPGEQFSGLQVLCLMYVAFRQTDPEIVLGLDFDEAYERALELFESQED